MVGKVPNIKVGSPLKLNHGLIGKHHTICHYTYNLALLSIKMNLTMIKYYEKAICNFFLFGFVVHAES